MSYSCPVTFEKVDSTVSRFSSLLISILVAYYLFSFNIYILYFLFIDFILRLFYKKDFSVVFIISKFFKKMFGLKTRLYDGGAKMLAGYFGIFFVLLLIIGNYLSLEIYSYIVGVVFLGCALLDVFFNYCVGCKVYFIIKKIYPSFMS